MHPTWLEYQMRERQADVHRAVRNRPLPPSGGGRPGAPTARRRRPTPTRWLGLALIWLGRRLAHEELRPVAGV